MIYYPDNNFVIPPDEEEEEEEWDREAYLDPMWEIQQKKTFTAWCNSHLRKAQLNISDIENDFRNGRQLIHLLETLSEEQLFKADKGNMRFHNLANVNKALSYIESKGVQLISIGAEEIVDGNVKMTLGMIWSIILRFAIQNITVEELSAKEGLLLWCKRKTAPYKNTNVQNFHFSWKDGLAFCALIHRHRPELIDYARLSKDNPIENLNYAFDVAEKYLDIPKMLDAEDMVNTVKPDERSVMAYVSSFYHALAGAQKAETAANRISKVLQINQENEKLMKAYETLASDLLEWINKQLPFLKNKVNEGGLDGARAMLGQYRNYRGDEKPPKIESKGELENIFNTLQTRLRLSNRPAYMPTEGHLVTDIQKAWNDLENNDKQFADWLVAEVKRLEKLDHLVKKFNLKCDTHENWAKDKSDIVKPRDYKSIGLCELKLLLKKLEGFEADLGTHQARVETIVALAEELNTLGYDQIQSVNDRTENIANEWGNLGEAAAKTRTALMEALMSREQIDHLQFDYAKRIAPFNNWMEQAQEDLKDPLFIARIEEITGLMNGHDTFKRTLVNAEKELNEIGKINTTVASIVTNNNLPDNTTKNPYTDIEFKDVEQRWQEMQKLIPSRDDSLKNELTRQQKIDQLRRQFAQLANQIGPWLDQEKHNYNSLMSQQKLNLDAQLCKLQEVEESMKKGRARVDGLENISKSLQELGVLDNHYTNYSMDTVRVNYEQLLTLIRRSINEVENQVLCRDTKGYSEGQIKEFRRCFNHFDKTRTRRLEPKDFKACLVSLGFQQLKQTKPNTDDTYFRRIMKTVDPNNTGYVTFDAFMDFVTKEAGDHDNVEQLTQSFTALANDQPYITRDILERELPTNQAEYCISKMPQYQGSDTVPGALDYRMFSSQLYGESEL